jgi:antitoxin HicB
MSSRLLCAPMEGYAVRTFVYSARFEPGEKRGIVVSFPDVPEAITQGDDEADAHAQAEEALGLALLTYPARGLPLPRSKTRGTGLVSVAVEPEVAAKLAVMDAVRAAGLSKSEFARRIGRDEKEARRILDPKHPTKLATLAAALRKLGQRLVIGVEPTERSIAAPP